VIRRPLGRSLAVAVIFAALLAMPSGAQTAPPTAYSGSSSATGVAVNLFIPGAPLSDSLVDTGGPTAQAAADSLSVGQGYAAFPNPGAIIQVAPGLIVGLVNQGVAGLPPIPLPSLPTYPLSVGSNDLKRDAAAGAGPYRIEAHSASGTAQGSATAGIDTSALGSASLMTSSASVGPTARGTVVATATSDVQGLTVALLNIGEVKTTATATLDAGGTITYSSSVEISALKVGGIGVSLDGNLLTTPGPTVALPLNSVLSNLLAATGVTVTLVPAQQYPDRIVAPAVVVSIPVNAQGVGSGPGSVSLTFGATTATVSGTVPTVDEAPGETSTDDGCCAAVVGTTTGTGTPTGDASIGAVPTPVASGAAPIVSGGVAAARPAAFVGLFDIRSLYLELVGCALAIVVLGQLLRLSGVRRRWTSSAG
jgi:hypothetical protein